MKSQTEQPYSLTIPTTLRYVATISAPHYYHNVKHYFAESLTCGGFVLLNYCLSDIPSFKLLQ